MAVRGRGGRVERGEPPLSVAWTGGYFKSAPLLFHCRVASGDACGAAQCRPSVHCCVVLRAMVRLTRVCTVEAAGGALGRAGGLACCFPGVRVCELDGGVCRCVFVIGQHVRKRGALFRKLICERKEKRVLVVTHCAFVKEITGVLLKNSGFTTFWVFADGAKAQCPSPGHFGRFIHFAWASYGGKAGSLYDVCSAQFTVMKTDPSVVQLVAVRTGTARQRFGCAGPCRVVAAPAAWVRRFAATPPLPFSSDCRLG